MTLQVKARHAIGQLIIDFDLSLRSSFTAVVGPSGAGKTTLLNIIAGLIRPDHGMVAIDDEVLVDTTRHIWTAPHRRHIGYVFQEARLFPHLNVRHNLTFARRHAGPGPSLDDVIGMLDLSELLSRRTPTLSGGERQRVALGRALLSSPRLLLLDEPLASVDVARRQEVLPYLDRLRESQQLPIIYVTHTWSEVKPRADVVIELIDGRVSPGGAPRPPE